DPAGSPPLGSGGNWGLEASRFPQSWNLLQAIRAKNATVTTGVVDAGFQAHADLEFTYPSLCRAKGVPLFEKCSATPADDHGNHVLGIIGAKFDNVAVAPRTLGVSGGNPVARMVGASANFSQLGTVAGLFSDYVDVVDMMVSQGESGALPNLRVINLSYGPERPNPMQADASGRTWWTFHPFPNCGPGQNDDGDPGSNQWCTPDTFDPFLQTVERQGKVALKVAEHAARARVLIIQAAEEQSHLWIPPGATTPLILRSSNVMDFGWASNHWTSALTNPIVMVLAMGTSPGMPLVSTPASWAAQSTTRAAFSDMPGPGEQNYLFAPGVNIWSTASTATPRDCAVATTPPTGIPWTQTISGNAYCAMSGTSMATPHVTALVGLLFAYNPDLSIQAVENAVFNWARPDITPARLDAFAALLSLPGAAKDLVDVSDGTHDGNQRRVLNAGGAQTEVAADPTGARTHPDGKIDMADFRRFRDAWLQGCDTGSTRDSLCPPAGTVRLNGTDVSRTGHLKRDLNFDGCVYRVEGGLTDPDACGTPEDVYARFDFNGDGHVSLDHMELMPLRADGTPAATRADGTLMNDLNVLQNQFDKDPAQTETWRAADLTRLMVSGDLEIHADPFFAGGAATVDISVRNPDSGESFATRSMRQTDGSIVITVPVTASPTSTFEVRGSAIVGGNTVESQIEIVSLHPGDDVRLDLGPPAPLTITYVWQQTVISGSLPPLYTRAPYFNALPPAGGTGSAPDCTNVPGSTDSPTLPGWHCTAIGGFSPAGAVLRRGGTLSSTGGAPFQLTESASGSSTYSIDWGLSIAQTPSVHYYVTSLCELLSFVSPDPNPVAPLLCHPGSDDVQVRVAAANTGAAGTAATYTNYVVPQVTAADQPDGVHVQGLRAVGELAYQHSYALNTRYPTFDVTTNCDIDAQACTQGTSVTTCQPGETTCQPGDYVDTFARRVVSARPFTGRPGLDPNEQLEVFSAIPPDLLLAPRGDGSALQFAADVTKPLDFPRLANGSLSPYSYCQVVPRTVDLSGGYHEPFVNGSRTTPSGQTALVADLAGDRVVGAS
ncbi:MAG TPA: S8 family serine peptidase, partial [Chloroflexota bacterium]|nr:S8 family serine peptidase [Chloroflexota bacterium]